MDSSTYTIIRNPTDKKYWETIYELVISVEKWFNTPSDYDIWREGFGEDFSFYFAIENATGKAIGSSCATNYRKLDGSEFLTASGMLFVHPDHRGKGIGMELAKKFSIGFENRSLIAVPSMSNKYATAFGYDKIPEDNMTDIDIQVNKMDLSVQLPPLEGVSIRSAVEADWPQILEYDRKMLKYSQRDKYIKLYCTQPNSYYKIAVDSSNTVVGVCLIRCNHEMKALYTGPFYAERPEVAEQLFVSTLKAISDLQHFEQLRLAFYTNSKTLEMVKKFVADEYTETHSHFLQFTKEIIPLPTPLIYSVTENDATYL